VLEVGFGVILGSSLGNKQTFTRWSADAATATAKSEIKGHSVFAQVCKLLEKPISNRPRAQPARIRHEFMVDVAAFLELRKSLVGAI